MDQVYTKVTLYTDDAGYARFKDEPIIMGEAGIIGNLSDVFSARAYQLRHSPVGFQSAFHCSMDPQWVFILDGIMEIELLDGTKRQFRPGESFFASDRLPEGAVFTEGHHGHRSRQVGDRPLRTLFLKV